MRRQVSKRPFSRVARVSKRAILACPSIAPGFHRVTPGGQNEMSRSDRRKVARHEVSGNPPKKKTRPGRDDGKAGIMKSFDLQDWTCVNITKPRDRE